MDLSGFQTVVTTGVLIVGGVLAAVVFAFVAWAGVRRHYRLRGS